jgi:hypothetical protein
VTVRVLLEQAKASSAPVLPPGHPVPGSSRRDRPGDQREAVQDLLQVHDLPGKELCDREPADIVGDA